MTSKSIYSSQDLNKLCGAGVYFRPPLRHNPCMMACFSNFLSSRRGQHNAALTAVRTGDPELQKTAFATIAHMPSIFG